MRRSLNKKEEKIYNKGFAEGVRLCLEDNNDAIRIGRAITETIEKIYSQNEALKQEYEN